MEFLHFFVDLILHLDVHLTQLLSQYGLWVYAILFVVIFCETGLVVTPFLPGDSLLFAVGALSAVDTSGTLQPLPAFLLLSFAAVLGNSTNYAIGRAIGPRAFSGRYRFLRVEHLRRTEQFFERHGGKTIIISRYVPIIRTFAPFVAGIGHMKFARFQLHNTVGGVTWVGLFVWGGYLFGNLPLIKENFGIVTILIIVLSLIPVALSFRKSEPSAAK